MENRVFVRLIDFIFVRANARNLPILESLAGVDIFGLIAHSHDAWYLCDDSIGYVRSASAGTPHPINTDIILSFLRREHTGDPSSVKKVHLEERVTGAGEADFPTDLISCDMCEPSSKTALLRNMTACREV